MSVFGVFLVLFSRIRTEYGEILRISTQCNLSKISQSLDTAMKKFKDHPSIKLTANTMKQKKTFSVHFITLSDCLEKLEKLKLLIYQLKLLKNNRPLHIS